MPESDEDDETDATFLASFQECQKCHWKGLAEDGGWTCPKCKTDWVEISFQVPAGKEDVFLKLVQDGFKTIIEGKK